MSCTIHTTTLTTTPRWIDRHRYEDVSTEANTALDGNEIIVSAQRGDQYPITLECSLESGWQLGSIVSALRALSAVVNAYYTLTLNGNSYRVRFRNEQSGGAVQMETVLPISAPADTDYYYGTIYLMCVG